MWLDFRFLLKFWLNWKNSSGEDTLFLKHFYFPINFTNFLKNICVDQVVLKIRFLNQEKISDQHYGKILDQEFKSMIYKVFQTENKEEM